MLTKDRRQFDCVTFHWTLYKEYISDKAKYQLSNMQICYFI